MPPFASTRITCLPVTSPRGPLSPYWNVRPARVTWSIQAFSVEGMPKLIMATAITTTSAARSSSIRASDCASLSRCSALSRSLGTKMPVTKSSSICATGSLARSRTITLACGCTRRSSSRTPAATLVEWEAPPRGLLVRRRMLVMGCSCIRGPSGGSSAGRIFRGPVDQMGCDARFEGEAAAVGCRADHPGAGQGARACKGIAQGRRGRQRRRDDQGPQRKGEELGHHVLAPYRQKSRDFGRSLWYCPVPLSTRYLPVTPRSVKGQEHFFWRYDGHR